MSVHKFEKPQLDDEMMTVTEYAVEAQGAMAYFLEQRSALMRVKDALGRSLPPSVAAFLDGEIAACSEQAEVAETATARWRDILGMLTQRSAKP